ncbi:glycerophosphodiester phosphodiesterase family protein [Pontibacter mangrovi]|uniref:Glycerophosphodiester phosphodiesterase n=1 Tax=Pontibacter mangrovi TaxID=2589816 RepID=A0A501VY89_9BACT|nr:glycerophosphodiester phosphodiesterase family protein [Pontibacter mangrovi]TPE41050.1 glycerophosphodiester phosphodiesterase [Pontibacter mangrovi]
MKKLLSIAALGLTLFAGCKSSQTPLQEKQVPLPAFDTEAHRGGRGLMPENTIPAMLHALTLGVTTLEMDCHITQDGKVVVTHDPHINHLYALTPEGKEFTKEESQQYAVYQLDYDRVHAFDVGSKPYTLYPHQQKMEAHIPLLADLIDSVQTYLKQNDLPQVFYNIEVKSKAEHDGKLHPVPEKFAAQVVDVVEQKGITPWVIIQSFDKRALQALHRQYPHIRASLLVSNKDSFEENIAQLGFTPAVYSPNAKLVTKELVDKCHSRDIKVVPWTVNTAEEIARLKAMGVDGIISDYPNLFNAQ